MTLEARMRDEIDRRIDRLHEEFGEFPVRERTVENDPDHFAHGVTLAEDGWLGDAGAWVTDEEGRALLIRHPEDPDRWGIPGGTHEESESFADTARREVREETGVNPELTGIWEVVRRTIVHEAEPGRRLFALTVRFVGRASGPASAAADDEVLEARWFAESPADVHDFLEPKVAEWTGDGPGDL